jgi:hypothetical protein
MLSADRFAEGQQKLTYDPLLKLTPLGPWVSTAPLDPPCPF